MKRALVILALAFLGCGQTDAAGSGGATSGGGAGGTAGAAGAPGAEVEAWARQVALGTEYGGDGKTIARFDGSPTLSVMVGTATDRADLDELLPVLNQELGDHEIQVVADADPSANIRVYYLPYSEFPAVGAANGFPVVPGNWGYFYLFWDQNHALTKAFVLLATDKLSGDKLRHFTFEEVTQSLGLASDSDVFPDSIFYASGADGGDATELSTLDRRLLRFVYAHTAPGDDSAAFDAAFDQYF